MGRAVQPSTSTSSAGVAWLVPVGVIVAAVGVGVLEAAGAVVSGLTGHGWRFAPLSKATAAAVARHGLTVAWPGCNPKAIGIVAVVLGVIVIAPPAALLLVKAVNAPAPDDPRRSLATARHLAGMLGRPAAARARRLRPSLAAVKPKNVPAGDIGVPLGGLRAGRGASKTVGVAGTVFASWEDVAVALMAPRSGKTTSLAVPAVLAAPGAVIVTSNKADVWTATAGLRRDRTGQPVWEFDPQRIGYVTQTWWIDLLDGLATIEDAERLAEHFVLTVEDERSRDIWGPAASELLSSLLLAAAVGGRTLTDVYEWLASEKAPAPVALLRAAGHDMLARTLQAVQDRPPETRGSVYFTAQAATKCLRNEAITAWVTPPPAGSKLAKFDPVGFATSRQTIYLLSKDGGGSAAPLVAAIADRIMRAGVVAAERAGGRLDPPMVVVLDEAANVCTIADLPKLYSHLGSRGIIPVTILQSYKQGVGVWGDVGMATLWSAATIKLVGAGTDDPDFAEEVSRLVGDHDVTTISNTGGGKGGASRTAATRQQRILPASAIRELPKGTALLLATGTKPALLQLRPWFTGPDAAGIAAADRDGQTRITRAADTTHTTNGGTANAGTAHARAGRPA